MSGKQDLVSWMNSRRSARTVRSVARNATNIKRKRPRRRGKRRGGYSVAKPFRLAYYKMLPSKEEKFQHQNTTMQTSTLANAVVATRFDNIIQGTQVNQRLRAAIHLSYLHVKGSIQNDGVVKQRFLRMIVLKEHNRANLNTTTFADLLTLSTGYSNGAPSQIQTDGANRINREQYEVLHDSRHKLPLESEGSLMVNKRIRINKVVYYPLAEPSSNLPTRGYLYFITLLYEGDTVTSTTTNPMYLALTAYFKDYQRQQ